MNTEDEALVGDFVTSLAIATGLGIGLGGLLGMFWDLFLERTDGLLWCGGTGFALCVTALSYHHFRQIRQSRIDGQRT